MDPDHFIRYTLLKLVCLVFIFGLLFRIAFFIFGIVLIFATYKSRIKGRLKLYLLLTGFSATGFLVFIILHNLVYALFIYLFGQNFWGGGDEALFFILAIFVCPIVFIIGVVGSLVLLLRKK